MDLDEKSKLAACFDQHSDVLFAYLFGSVAEGTSTLLSDLDLAVYVKDGAVFGLQKKLHLHNQCCRALKRDDIDLIVLNQTRNILLREQVARHGVLLYCRDQVKKDDFELRAVHQSIDFKGQRMREMGL